MGVALENARLFDETKRLLSETNERAAELALINDVQHGLAQKLDRQSMYDLVGDRIQAIFDAQIVDIAVVEPEHDQVRFLYTIERGVRFPEESLPIIGPRRHVIETRKPLVFNRDVQTQVALLGQEPGMTSGEQPLSAVWVPLVVGDEVRGIMSLQNIDREDAFSDSDVELLTTLAASLSVALENVRLIDETRQRLAELATVNEVGQALSSQLDLERRSSSWSASRCAGRSRPTSATSHSTTRRARRDRVPLLQRVREADRPGAVRIRRGPDVADLISQREPLLLNRESDWDAIGTRGVGTACQVLPRRADPRRRPSDRGDQRPEHAAGGSLRRVRRPPSVDDRGQRRRRDPERPAVPGGAPPRRRDGGPRRGRPGDLGDARRPSRPRADRRAGPWSSCSADSVALFLADRRARHVPSDPRHRRAGRCAAGGHDPRGRGDHRRRHPPTGARVRQRHRCRTPGRSRSPAPRSTTLRSSG